MIVVEHPATITLGRHAPEADVVVDDKILASKGVEIVRTDRGGRATFHGPGQVVVYPIVAIGELGLGVKSWIELLEEAVIATLAEFEVEGVRHEGNPGVWAPGGKIASVGLRIVDGVSSHGLALNVNLDVGAFDYIVTCGIPDEAVTTLAAECAADPATETVESRLSGNLIDRIDARRGT